MVAQRPSLGQVQLEQNERGRIICRLAPRNGPTLLPEDQQFLVDQVKQYLGDGTAIEFDIVSRIEHETSGKYRFSKSTLKDLF